MKEIDFLNQDKTFIISELNNELAEGKLSRREFFLKIKSFIEMGRLPKEDTIDVLRMILYTPNIIFRTPGNIKQLYNYCDIGRKWYENESNKY